MVEATEDVLQQGLRDGEIVLTRAHLHLPGTTQGAVGQGMSIYLLHDQDQFHILVPLVIGGITADLLLRRIMVVALVKWTMHGVDQGVQRVIVVVLLDLVHDPIVLADRVLELCGDSAAVSRELLSLPSVVAR